MFIAIIGATAIIGAIGVFWWGITATPSRARANLFAGLDSPTESPKVSYLQQFGTAVRRFIPHPLVDGLEVKLVQAGHPYGLDLPRILGVKFTLAAVSGGLMFLLGQPLFALVAAVAVFFLPDYAVASMKEKRQDEMRGKSADMIDQMTICVEAGLGFDAALNRVASTNDGPLAEEIQRTIADLPRRHAPPAGPPWVGRPGPDRRSASAGHGADPVAAPRRPPGRDPACSIQGDAGQEEAADRGEGGQAGDQNDLPGAPVLHARLLRHPGGTVLGRLVQRVQIDQRFSRSRWGFRVLSGAWSPQRNSHGQLIDLRGRLSLNANYLSPSVKIPGCRSLMMLSANSHQEESSSACGR